MCSPAASFTKRNTSSSLNILPQQTPYVASLDHMYDFMCQLYGVAVAQSLAWKAPIFAFLEREQSDAFEERYFPESRETIRALEMSTASAICVSGEVTISVSRQRSQRLRQMLVHDEPRLHPSLQTKAQLPNCRRRHGRLIAPKWCRQMVVRNRAESHSTVKQRPLGGMFAPSELKAGSTRGKQPQPLPLQLTGRITRFIESLKDGMKWRTRSKTLITPRPTSRCQTAAGSTSPIFAPSPDVPVGSMARSALRHESGHAIQT